MTQFWNLGTPNISRTVEARNFKLARIRKAVSSDEENAKLGQSGIDYTGTTVSVNQVSTTR